MQGEQRSVFNGDYRVISNGFEIAGQSVAVRDQDVLDELHAAGKPIDFSLKQKVLKNNSFTAAVLMMRRAHELALDCNLASREFAVEISDLQAVGLSKDEIRWMLGKGLLTHLVEASTLGSKHRRFLSINGFTLNDRSCFVLSEAGLQLATRLLKESHQQSDAPRAAEVAVAHELPCHPTWDSERHELKVGSTIVKRFKWRAINQEAILNAFEEEGWPARIDDPLSPKPDTDPKRRLSDAIKCLNRKQQQNLVRFSGDGTGEGIIWRYVDVE